MTIHDHSAPCRTTSPPWHTADYRSRSSVAECAECVAKIIRCVVFIPDLLRNELGGFTREGYQKIVIVEPSYAFSKCEIGFKVAIHTKFKRLDT